LGKELLTLHSSKDKARATVEKLLESLRFRLIRLRRRKVLIEKLKIYIKEQTVSYYKGLVCIKE